jgi:WD40 repeat protein
MKRGLFIHTGSFTLKVTPLENITITVDGQPVPMKTLNILNNAFHIDSQMPGEHFLRVSAPGYSAWEKKAVIESGHSTEFWNITLIGNDYPETPIEDTEAVTRIFPSPDTHLFALLGMRRQGIVLKTLESATLLTSEIAFIPDTTLSVSGDENLEWSPDTKRILLPLTDAHGDGVVYLIDTESGGITDITEKSRLSHIRYPRWDDRQKGTFYFLSDNTLYTWSAETLDTPPVALIPQMSGYDISQNFIYFIDRNTGIVFRLKSDDSIENAEQITEQEIPNPSAPASLTVYDEDRIAIRNRDNGALFIFNRGQEDYFHSLGDNIRSVQFSNDGKKLLFESDTDISVYFVRPWNTQPIREENETLQIARFSSPIKFVQWTKDYEHVIFSYNNQIKTIELDHRDRRDMQTVRTLPLPPEQILADFPDDQLFLIGRKEGSTLSTLPFPIVPIKKSVTP